MLQNDFDLQTAQVQTLSNRDAIVELFTHLGYNTEARLVQTTAAMGFTGDALAHEITRIERVADHEGELQVYLVEMKHVTVAITQALARALRNRAGNFLLVLTTDYEQIDFVLMELIAPESKQTGFGMKQAYRRPRGLTVNRRNPTAVDLRVLRRFSYTESDPWYQWDKLRSAYGIAEWSEPFFDNRALFSDYYLTERLKDTPQWQENPAQALRAFQGLLDGARQRVSGKPESVVRTELIEPALKALGFEFKPGKPGGGGAGEADYNLFARQPRAAALPPAAKPIAFCDAYVWGRNLDGRDETRDTETLDENPGALVVSLLERQDAPDWGIVTNGKTWRLYSARTHSRATNYYEIDLEEAVTSPDPQFAFRYFWLFFRAAAFLRDGAANSFLDCLVEGSELYANELGERLKDRVFEKIFPQFAEGFIANIRNREGAKAELEPERSDAIFHGTLTFLYRLLFLLYAEARDLLPVRDVRGYYEISLTRLKREVADRAGDIVDEGPEKLAQAYSPTSTQLYERLAKLFATIDGGNAALNVPLYNGGLFITTPTPDDTTPEAINARFLAANKIPDRFLALGLDRMARDLDDRSQALAMIDFKSLGVRQLGSIYEGVLEFKLRVAAEKLAVVKGKRTEEVIPYRKAGNQRVRETISKGQVYLENDKSERKATGSYYTPDYIVKYIVDHTVGPVLQEKCEALRPKLREAQKKYRDAVARQQAFKKQGMPGDDPQKVANSLHGIVDELFDLRVLDPAMGSGHFLVEAVDFITDQMLYFLNGFPWNPVTAALRQTREMILDQMQQQGVTIDETRLTDVNLLKRHVLKRCVYGVDLNPMAVELAKVSLWLDCFTLGAPLSFLDHHLKCGNSLIGARIADARARLETSQLSMFGSSLWAGAMLATDKMIQVGHLSDVTAQQVAESKHQYHDAVDALAPFKRMLDVYTSRWFGNEVVKGKRGRADVDKTADFLHSSEAEHWLWQPDDTRGLNVEQKQIAQTARQAADASKFFHWELEFPEVFFGPSKASAQEIVAKESAGFDAVIGNPPYVRIQTQDVPSATFLLQTYQSSVGKFDIFVSFMEKGILLLNRRGRLGFIVPNKFLTADYGSGIRGFISRGKHLRGIVDFREHQVFAGVATYTCLLFCSGAAVDEVEVMFGQADVIEGKRFVMRTGSLHDGPWILRSSEPSIEPKKLVTLGQVCDAIFQGLITGGDKLLIGRHEGDSAIFSGEEFPLEPGVVKPLLKGKDIARFGIHHTGGSVIYPYRHGSAGDVLIPERELEEQFPATYAYLRKHKKELSQRGSDSMEYDTWYALWCPRQIARFRSPKILAQVLAAKATFALDEAGHFWFVGGGNAGVYGIIPRNDLEVDVWYLLGVLNSHRFDELVHSASSRFRGGYFSYAKRFIEHVPLRAADFSRAERDAVERISELVKARCHMSGGGNESQLEDEINRLIDDLYRA